MQNAFEQAGVIDMLPFQEDEAIAAARLGAIAYVDATNSASHSWNPDLSGSHCAIGTTTGTAPSSARTRNRVQ